MHNDDRQIDLEDSFLKVLEIYEEKLMQAIENTKKTIRGYLGKKTVEDVLTDHVISRHSLKLHFDKYANEPLYQSLKHKNALAMLSEYGHLPKYMIQKKLIYPRFFDFFSLIEDKEYQEIDSYDYENDNVVYKTIPPNELFDEESSLVIVNVQIYLICFIDAKIHLLIKDDRKTLEGILFSAIRLNEAPNMIKSLHNARIDSAIDWNNFHLFLSVDSMRKHQSAKYIQNINPNDIAIMKDYIQSNLGLQIHPQILDYCVQMLNNQFEATVYFHEDKESEIDICIGKGSDTTLPLKLPNCSLAVLKHAFNARKSPDNPTNQRYMSSVNTYFWKNFLINEILVIDKLTITLNPSYIANIHPKFGRKTKVGKQRCKRK